MAFKELPNLDQCRPFAYDRESTDRGSRIGGTAPANAKPYISDVYSKYFSTIEFETGWAVSLFIPSRYSETMKLGTSSRLIIRFFSPRI
jgi:hypothetical protein